MSADSSSCMETTSAEWIFSVTASSAIVALITAVVWLALLSLAKSPPEPLPKPSVSPLRTWALRAWAVIAFAQTVHFGWSTRHEPHETMITVTTLAVLAYPVAGVLLLARRFRRTGQRPAPHRAPLGMFWVLPVMFAAAVVTCGWSIHTQIASMVPCRPHTRSAGLNTDARQAGTSERTAAFRGSV